MFKDKRKKVIVASASIVLMFLLVISVRGRMNRQREVLISDMPEEVEQKILSFELANYAENGSKKWNLKGDSADILAEIVNLNNIDMETYEDPKITLTALRGTYDRDSKDISLFDNVKVLTADGARLNTEYLKWNGETDTITSDKPVRIIRSDVIADGHGALAYPQMKKIILNKDIVVKLAGGVMGDVAMSLDDGESQDKRDEESAKATITCDGPLGIDYENNIAIFENDVLVEDMKGKIYSDKMQAFLDPVTKNIVKVIAEGDVRVVRGEDSTHSEKAIYTTADQKIVLIGSPKIYIHSTEDLDKMERKLEGF